MALSLSSAELPFALKIVGLQEAVSLAAVWATHTVSLIDPEEQFDLPLPGPHGRLCRHYFHDAVPGHADDPLSELFHTVLATPEQLTDILNFTATVAPGDRLLVHCYAGISRSTAVACGVLCQHGYTPAQAVAQVQALRALAIPNPYLLALFDQLLGLKPGLVQAAATLLPR